MTAELHARSIPYYPVPDVHLGDALAGRLLAQLGKSKPDRNAADWLFCEGFAAGVRWAWELATFADLDKLTAADRLPWRVAPPWLRGFIDGALRAGTEMDTTQYHAVEM